MTTNKRLLMTWTTTLYRRWSKKIPKCCERQIQKLHRGREKREQVMKDLWHRFGTTQQRRPYRKKGLCLYSDILSLCRRGFVQCGLFLNLHPFPFLPLKHKFQNKTRTERRWQRLRITVYMAMTNSVRKLLNASCCAENSTTYILSWNRGGRIKIPKFYEG